MQAVTPLELSSHAPFRASVQLRVDLPPAHAPTGAGAGARARVELYGEAGDFLSGVPLLPVAPAHGTGSATAVGVELSLPRGVYAYKLKVDGVWTLDPSNARTRSTGGARNNLLVVGGAAEPIVFAPAPPFVFEEDSGELVVTAALRRGHGAALEVLVDEGHGERTFRMQPALEEDEHVVFRADLPASAARVRLRFAIDGGAPVGAEDGSAFEWERPARGEAVPAFWRDAVVYTIFVDRFRPVADRPDWGVDPGPGRFAGGHLEGIRRSLDDLRDLGVDVLYLTPVHAGASCHRYDVTDPLAVDPRLGGEAAFAALARDAHARGMRILVDFSFSHAGRGFPPYEDVIRNGRASRHAAWFQWKDETTLRHYGTRTDAPLFDATHPEVAALAILAAERWARRGADGLRLDAAAEVPHGLARAVRDRFRKLRPEGIVLGEVIPPHAWRWRAEGAVDVATDFGFHTLAGELLATRTVDAATAAARLAAGELTRGGPRHAALRFLSTHDHVRFATSARMAGDASQTRARAQLGLLWLLAMPGIPALLYGEEVGIATRPDDVGFEGVWTDRAPMPWPADAAGRALREKVRALIAARRASPALSRGGMAVVHAEERTLVVRRSAGGDVADVVVHAGDEAIEIHLDDPELPRAELVVSVGEVRADGARLLLGPGAGAIVRRSAGPPAATHTSAAAVAVRDRAFVLGDVAGPVRPTRIDFAVTERCNLRCQHCITQAPARTRDGTARTLTPFVLDRLRPDLALASYFGFVHGGESLTAPIFFDVLGAIRGARGAAPTQVHLLTNGTRLGEATAARLVEHGVTSISVSLDGATPAVNDAVRAGSSLAAIAAGVREVARARDRAGWDLRLGLSFVLLRENVGELTAFVELARDLGVDWVKLEEPVGATPYARSALVDVEALLVRRHVERALARAAALGLVAVDHTRPMPPWRCRLDADPPGAARLAADEHANRSRIHPCLAPWEIACIEPSGCVRQGDFFGAILGNVVETPLADLWRGDVAARARRRAMATRPCGVGPVTCMPPQPA